MSQEISQENLTKSIKQTATTISVNCVRNTVIENYHAGTFPKSKTGDYSDVKVVTPFGEIAWNELSRISDEEMKAFNIEVNNRIYTYLQALFNPKYADAKNKFMKFCRSMYPNNWNEPKLDKGFLGIKEGNSLSKKK
ncbi:hypothetical protein MC378_14180 [Polaribacter sp. MSW13]|uniref:Uncharacterized protein n=1 Tax=Polaribacter marinus TaxID=2916838 RepID=A0A9X2AL84_9FLAO|nr:hypothetical protein [Polaribacter marinus]MCI2230323.1 hypothetical protein [Polaribacter marinus]